MSLPRFTGFGSVAIVKPSTSKMVDLSTPNLTMGTWTRVRVRQVGNAIGIYLNNGSQLAYFEDLEA